MEQINYYKIGSKWDGNGGNYYQAMKENKVIIFKNDKPLKINDIGAVSPTGGHEITDIGIVKSECQKLSSNKELKDEFHEIDHNITNYDPCYYKVDRIPLNNSITYQLQQGWCKINDGNVKKEIKKQIISFVMTTKKKEGQEKITKILQSKKNLILTGAPGTGKTYKTAEIAVNLIDPNFTYSNRNELMLKYQELVKDGQIAFTTFHQSMDYEEFVEGLKPDTEEVGKFEVKAGIFKQMCEKAKQNWNDSNKSAEFLQTEFSVKAKLDTFLVDAIDNDTEFQTKTGSKFKIIAATDNFIIISIPENEITSKIKVNLNDAIELLQKNISIQNVNDIRKYFNRKFNTQQDSYIFVILNEVNKIKNVQITISSISKQDFVLIIDEINRGNISKILGELITLLEADKRLGETNAISVTLPYSNEQFSVPQNLYIIGTMNTADRSLGYIDYAIRRRFAFKTLKTNENNEIANFYDENKLNEKLKNKAVALFTKIKTDYFAKEKISSEFNPDDLMIGHSYFMAKDEAELEQKLEYEMKPLLLEYISDGILNVKKDEIEI